MKNLCYILFVLSLVFSCKNEKQHNDELSTQAETSTKTINFTTLEDAVLSSGTLVRIDSFPSNYITPRPVDVWLPEQYSKENKYSVLYMHDGQMLFDSTATWNNQEWKVDEWASQLMNAKKTKDFIVVAVHNIPEIRWQDLFPQKAFNFLPNERREELIIKAKKDLINITDLHGDNYLKFIVKELKPEIDKQFAVHTDKANTVVMGSSMGGLMSMYAVSEYPEVFGGAGCLSTHWPGAQPQDNNPYPDAIFRYMEATFPKAGHHKVYFDYGNKTLDAHYPQYAPRVDAILKAKGYTKTDAKHLFFENTDHSENSWNARLDEPLVFLLGK